MKTMRLFPLELKRLLQSRLTWLMMALTVLSPVLGLVLYKSATSTTMLSMYLANPAIAGGVAGAILFGLLTIFELDRACRSRVDILTDAVVSPLTTALTRLLALLTAAVLTVGLTMLVWMPISAGRSAPCSPTQTMCWPICCSWGWRCPWASWRRQRPTSSPAGRICPSSCLLPSAP